MKKVIALILIVCFCATFEAQALNNLKDNQTQISKKKHKKHKKKHKKIKANASSKESTSQSFKM